MKTLLITFLLLQPAISQQAGARVRGRVTLMPAQTMTSLEFDLLGGDPATRRTKVNLAQDGSFDVPGLTPGTYEVYLMGRVVATFQFSGNDITNLTIAPKPPRAEFRVVRGRVSGDDSDRSTVDIAGVRPFGRRSCLPEEPKSISLKTDHLKFWV
jgi:hypothetical protein